MDSHFRLIQTFFNFIDLKKNESNNKVQNKSLARLAQAGAASGGKAGVCCRCGRSRWGTLPWRCLCLPCTLPDVQHKTLPLMADLQGKAPKEGEELADELMLRRAWAWCQRFIKPGTQKEHIFPALGWVQRLLTPSMSGFPKGVINLKLCFYITKTEVFKRVVNFIY